MADQFDPWRIIGPVAGCDNHLVDQGTGRLQHFGLLSGLYGPAEVRHVPGVDLREIRQQRRR